MRPFIDVGDGFCLNNAGPLAYCAGAEVIRMGEVADDSADVPSRGDGDFIADHRGMFSRIGATPEQVETLREKHGIYMVGDSRMNIAGLNAETVPILAEAIVSVGV